MTNLSATLWAALSLTAAAFAPSALATVGDEFVCHVGFRDANNVKRLGTQVNFAVIREPVGRAPGYDLSTAGSAEIHTGAPQDELSVAVHLDYQHDLKLGPNHAPLRAQQSTCLSGSVTRAGVTESVRSDGCDGDPQDVEIVQSVPAFDVPEVTAHGVSDQGSLSLVCRHLRSVLR